MKHQPVTIHSLTFVPIKSGRGRVYAIRSIPGSPRPHFLFASKKPMRRYDERLAVGVLTCNPDHSSFSLEHPRKTFLGRTVRESMLGDAYRLLDKREKYLIGNWDEVCQQLQMLTSTGVELPLT